MSDLNVLIPLDGTKRSESALAFLPLLKSLGFNQVNLVSVWESAWEEPGEGERQGEFKEAMERGRSYLETYLKEAAGGLIDPSIDIRTTVKVGHAAEETLHEAESSKADLILLATHGREGIERFRLGSVADKIIRASECPVLVVGPNVKTALAPYRLNRMLVPLDGSEQSEQCLPVARWLAQTEGAAVDLVRVISSTMIAMDPGTEMAVEPGGIYAVDLVTAVEDAAAMYLERMAASLGEGVQVRTSVLLGAVADEILKYLESEPADLVIMNSHGRRGLLRSFLGSVADRMLHGPAPVLILRPGEMGSSSRLLQLARSR